MGELAWRCLEARRGAGVREERGAGFGGRGNNNSFYKQVPGILQEVSNWINFFNCFNRYPSVVL